MYAAAFNTFWLTLLCSALLNRKVARRSFEDKFVIEVWHSLDLLCFQNSWELRKNKVESWWRHWSSGLSSRKRPDLQIRVGWLFKTYFPSRSLFTPDFPVVLNSLKSSSLSSELTVVLSTAYYASLTAWPMLNVYHFKLGKEPFNPRFGTTPPPHWIAG